MQNISVDEDPAGDRQVERACKEEENRPGAGREREGEREGERERVRCSSISHLSST